MIELAFVVCLATAPEVCEDRSLVFAEGTTSQCYRGAQPELARWVAGHERWRIARWTCRTVDGSQQI